jgi:methyltransferase (TIGR00027 family)
MRKGTASRTAMWVAAMRGLARLDEPALVRDPLAKGLLPLRYSAILRVAEGAPNVSRVVLRGLARVSNNLVRHMAFRTRAIDDVVTEDAGQGTRQLVLLGAGFDARAWRLEALGETRVFEVDHPDTQAAKRQGIGGREAVAREVVWVPMDFTRETLGDVLARAGHDASRPTTFVWEGVTMYLSGEDIDATLAVVAARAARGSRLAVTYHDSAFAPESVMLDVLVRVAGEPFRTRMSADEMRNRLSGHGFEVERDEGSDVWSERYLGERGYRTNERLVVAG